MRSTSSGLGVKVSNIDRSVKNMMIGCTNSFHLEIKGGRVHRKWTAEMSTRLTSSRASLNCVKLLEIINDYRHGTHRRRNLVLVFGIHLATRQGSLAMYGG